MTVKLVGSTSGSVSLQAPASTSGGAHRVLTLPDANATLATTSDSFGKILQVVQTFKNDTTSTSGNSHDQIPGLTVTITPSSSSSKILYSGHLYIASTSSEAVFRLRRTIAGSTFTEIATPSTYQDDEDGVFAHGGGSRYGGQSFQFLDSPNTTSAVTYGISWQTHSGTTYLNRTWDSGWFHGISTLTAMEVAS
tara:strand:+ start:439 stop:1020 length:582 start_codon:yes stop_codon:yes gene_type:complete